MYKLDSPKKNEYSHLLDIWESSVKATHQFLREGDIDFFKNIIQEKDIFSHTDLSCIRDGKDEIIGFMGVSGNELDMLFISPSVMKQGVGRRLLLYAIHNLGVTRVDVNEQNEQAIRFYERFGFQVISRSELDGNGKPYPILHMERK